MKLTSLEINMAMGFGVPEPVEESIAYAFNRIEILQTVEGMSSCYIILNANRTLLSAIEYDMLLTPQTAIGNRVIVTALANLLPTVLFDGIITRRELSYEAQTSATTVTLAIDDVSYALQKTQHSRQFPDMTDAEIVGLLLLEYAEYGLIPEITPVPSADIPSIQVEQVPQQNASDFDYIRSLARKHGCYFYIQPGPVPGTNRAFWGPPMLASIPQSPLLIDFSTMTNVQRANFSFDPTQATSVAGEILDETTNEPEPIETIVSTRVPLSLGRALLSSVSRKSLFTDPRYGGLQSEASAQAITDFSADTAMSGTITVDTLKYGSIVSKGGVIGVQGAGILHDGFYYVRKVKHVISKQSYTQEITITREGAGTTTETVL